MVLTGTGTHKSHIDSCDVSCRPERSEPTSFPSVQHVHMGICNLTMFFHPPLENKKERCYVYNNFTTFLQQIMGG